MANKIEVAIDVKSSAAVGAFAGLTASITSAGIGLAKAGIDAAIDAIGDSISLASDKAESASKVNVLFGESADAIHEASQRAAETVGMSSGKYLEAAGNLGNLLTGFDLSTEAAAGMSQNMIQLAADLGSFNNADPTEVVEAMGAAMRGEQEPLRRFVQGIDEAAIKAKGLELGLDASSTSTDKAGRAQAIYALMVENSSAAQGDFARTSEGMANTQRINAAKMEDALTRIGEALLPVATMIEGALGDAIDGLAEGIDFVIEAVEEWVDDNDDLIDTIADVAGIVWKLYQQYISVLIEVIGELGYRVGGLIGLFIDLGGAMVDVGGGIASILRGDFEQAARHGELLAGRVGSFAENVQRAIGDTGRRMADDAEIQAARAEEAVDEAWESAAETTGTWWARMGDAAADEGDGIGFLFADHTADAVKEGTPKVDAAAESMGDVIPENVAAAQREAAQIAQQTPGEIAQGLRSRRDAVSSAMDQLKEDMHNAIKPAKEIAELEGMLAGRRLERGLASTNPIVRAQAEATRDLIQARLDDLKDGAYKAGEQTGSALTRGLRSQADNAKNAADRIAQSIQDSLKLGSPAKAGPWSKEGGPIAWAEKDAALIVEGLTRGFTRAIALAPDVLDKLSPNLGPDVARFSGTPSARAGRRGDGGWAPLTVNVYAGVGDPVEIGRQVSDALRAYQRASGTEAG